MSVCMCVAVWLGVEWRGTRLTSWNWASPQKPCWPGSQVQVCTEPRMVMAGPMGDSCCGGWEAGCLVSDSQCLCTPPPSLAAPCRPTGHLSPASQAPGPGSSLLIVPSRWCHPGGRRCWQEINLFPPHKQEPSVPWFEGKTRLGAGPSTQVMAGARLSCGASQPAERRLSEVEEAGAAAWSRRDPGPAPGVCPGRGPGREPGRTRPLLPS